MQPRKVFLVIAFLLLIASSFPAPYFSVATSICNRWIRKSNTLTSTTIWAYGSIEGEQRYNPAADLDDNDEIDWEDLLLLAWNYGKTV